MKTYNQLIKEIRTPGDYKSFGNKILSGGFFAGSVASAGLAQFLLTSKTFSLAALGAGIGLGTGIGPTAGIALGVWTVVGILLSVYFSNRADRFANQINDTVRRGVMTKEDFQEMQRLGKKAKEWYKSLDFQRKQNAKYILKDMHQYILMGNKKAVQEKVEELSQLMSQ